MTLKEMREKAGELAKEMRRLSDLVNNENRDFTSEEKGQWEKVNKDYDEMRARIDREERLASVESQMQAPAGGENRGGVTGRGDLNAGGENREGEPITEEQRARAISSWARAQLGHDVSEGDADICRRIGLNPNSRNLFIAMPNTRSRRQIRDAFRSVHPTRAQQAVAEMRSPMSSHIMPDGGALVFPSFVSQLEINMLAFGGMRQVADSIITSTGERMGWPTADDTGNTGEQVGESANVDNSGAGGVKPTFGQVFWDAYKFSSKAILVPYELLQDSFIDLPSVLGQMMGERLGRITNTKFTNGSGNGTPHGLMNVATLGRTAASATAIEFDDVIRLEHSVDPPYRIGAGYMCHDSIVLALRLLKDGEGRYIWQSGANAGRPDTLNAHPFTVNQDMDSAVTASKKVLLYGQLNKYKIRTVGAIRLYRLEERYRDSDNDGFIALLREDGNLLDAGTAPVKYLQMDT